MRYVFQFLVLVLLLVGVPALTADKPSQSFQADPNIQKVAEAYSLDAIDFSKKQFGITLDWTDGSIANVEKALALMHSSYAGTTPRPTEEQVMSYAKAYGSYVGEVYRRNHGAEWGIIDLGGQKFPGLRTKSGTNFWPWGRAFNRIVEGAENNIADYYKVLLEQTP
jgi:hypothetical protein